MKQSLFRSIRRKLLGEGKLVRYLTYALGEILLIVVGIMLALQLNNWNEDRKEQVEFDEYIVQLREDVKAAIDLVENRSGNAERQATQAMTILNVVEGTEADPEDVEAFEYALGNLGKFAMANIPYGNLRELLDGDFDAIEGNKELVNKVYALVSFMEGRMRIIGVETKRLEYSEGIFVKFRGLERNGSLPDGVEIPVRYDLDKLRASEDFIYAIHNAIHTYVAANQSYDRIVEELVDFLTVLEEYE